MGTQVCLSFRSDVMPRSLNLINISQPETPAQLKALFDEFWWGRTLTGKQYYQPYVPKKEQKLMLSFPIAPPSAMHTVSRNFNSIADFFFYRKSPSPSREPVPLTSLSSAWWCHPALAEQSITRNTHTECSQCQSPKHTNTNLIQAWATPHK